MMRDIILYTAASLDMYIARQDGDVSWLHSSEFKLPDEDYGYKEFYETTDTTLMGHNTLKVTLAFDIPFPYPDKSNYVFTRSETNQDTEHFQFIHGDIITFVRQLKKEKGKNIWLIGGSEINSMLLSHDLIDTMIITLIPMTLGAGIPLFSGTTKETLFDLKKIHAYDSGFVQMIWHRKINCEYHAPYTK